MAFDSRLSITIDTRDGMVKLRDFEDRLDRAERAGDRLTGSMERARESVGSLTDQASRIGTAFAGVSGVE